MPDSELLYYYYVSECALAVLNGKADMTFAFDAQSDEITEQYDELAVLESIKLETDTAFVTKKNDEGKALADEFNAFFADISANGEHDAIHGRWYGGDEIMPDYDYSGEKGELSIVVESDYYPQTFIKDGEYAGYSYDLACAFCAYAGYTPVYENVPVSAALAGYSTRRYDFFIYGVGETAERDEIMSFTRAITYDRIDLLTTREKYAALTGAAENSLDTARISKAEAFIEGLANSFEKNFIREDRWQLMLRGLGVTVLLAIASALFGTLLGALICYMRMSKKPFLTGFARIYIKLFQGMPIVVLLLVLYYIIFGKTDVSALIVCIIGFSLDFSAYVSEIIRTGIEAVPAGQSKAAYALGFGKARAFMKVVLPQAMRHILPVYRGQFVSMVKMTSIAGYISVQDLTKVSDIIRSRTYEAFFPLITTAIIYFLLAAILVTALKMIESKTDPKLRKGNTGNN